MFRLKWWNVHVTVCIYRTRERKHTRTPSACSTPPATFITRIKGGPDRNNDAHALKRDLARILKAHGYLFLVVPPGVVEGL